MIDSLKKIKKCLSNKVKLDTSVDYSNFSLDFLTSRESLTLINYNFTEEDFDPI